MKRYINLIKLSHRHWNMILRERDYAQLPLLYVVRRLAFPQVIDEQSECRVIFVHDDYPGMSSDACVGYYIACVVCSLRRRVLIASCFACTRCWSCRVLFAVCIACVECVVFCISCMFFFVGCFLCCVVWCCCYRCVCFRLVLLASWSGNPLQPKCINFHTGVYTVHSLFIFCLN